MAQSHHRILEAVKEEKCCAKCAVYEWYGLCADRTSCPCHSKPAENEMEQWARNTEEFLKPFGKPTPPEGKPAEEILKDQEHITEIANRHTSVLSKQIREAYEEEFKPTPPEKPAPFHSNVVEAQRTLEKPATWTRFCTCKQYSLNGVCEHTSINPTPPKVKKIQFWECELCRRKPGSPILCIPCIQRRDIIEALNTLLE